MDGEPGDGGSNFETPEYVHPETLEPETPNFILQVSKQLEFWSLNS